MAEHNELGEKGEAVAIDFLRKAEYKILEINWRHSRLEVDVIAQKANTLILVEVKTRNTDFFGTPESFVNSKKQNMMAEAAEAYIFTSKIKDIEVRYDIISILLKDNKVDIKHIEDAFFPNNLGLNSFDF